MEKECYDQTHQRKNQKNVVRVHIQEGRTLQSLAFEYSVSRATISNWVRAYREECQTNDEEKNSVGNSWKYFEECESSMRKSGKRIVSKKDAVFFAVVLDYGEYAKTEFGNCYDEETFQKLHMLYEGITSGSEDDADDELNYLSVILKKLSCSSITDRKTS